MAKKKRFLLLLLVCVAAAALLVLGGCKPKPIEEGPETGVYYCDADGGGVSNCLKQRQQIFLCCFGRQQVGYLRS